MLGKTHRKHDRNIGGRVVNLKKNQSYAFIILTELVIPKLRDNRGFFLTKLVYLMEGQHFM